MRYEGLLVCCIPPDSDRVGLGVEGVSGDIGSDGDVSFGAVVVAITFPATVSHTNSGCVTR